LEDKKQYRLEPATPISLYILLKTVRNHQRWP